MAIVYQSDEGCALKIQHGFVAGHIDRAGLDRCVHERVVADHTTVDEGEVGAASHGNSRTDSVGGMGHVPLEVVQIHVNDTGLVGGYIQHSVGVPISNVRREVNSVRRVRDSIGELAERTHVCNGCIRSSEEQQRGCQRDKSFHNLNKL